MNIKPELLAQALQQTLAPLYLVAGPEPLLVQESRDLILQAAKEHGFLERIVYQVGNSFDWDGLHSEAMEQSLFSSRKVIDVRLPTGKPGRDGGQFFTKWAKNPEPDRLLIVSCSEWESSSRKSGWATKLGAVGVLVEIWPVKTGELIAWINRRLRAAGLQPERGAVTLLAELVEGNLLAAQQEIEKLALLNPGGKVTADAIGRSVANNSRFNGFRLGECVFNGQAGDCLKVAAGLRRTGVAIQAVSGALYYQLSQLSAVHSAVQSGENEARAFSRLRVIKMVQPSFRQALRRLSEKQIGDSFQALSLVDRQGKGRASGDPWQTLDQMLLELCAIPKASRRAGPAHF